MATATTHIKITHHAYKHADFFTGNAFTPHQYSQVIRANRDKAAKEHPGRNMSDLVAFDLECLKKSLPDHLYKFIVENALQGTHQTVYLIRHKNIKQGVLVLDHMGRVLSIYNLNQRHKSYELLGQIGQQLSDKMKAEWLKIKAKYQINVPTDEKSH